MITYALILLWIILSAYREHYSILLFESAYPRPDYHPLKKKWYRYAFLNRATLTVLIAYLAHGFTVEAVLMAGTITVLWWIIYDEVLNLLRTKDFLYVGIEAGPDRFIRSIADRIGLDSRIIAAVVKGVALIVMICFILIWK